MPFRVHCVRKQSLVFCFIFISLVSESVSRFDSYIRLTRVRLHSNDSRSTDSTDPNSSNASNNSSDSVVICLSRLSNGGDFTSLNKFSKKLNSDETAISAELMLSS